jgi:hypothetical protein
MTLRQLHALKRWHVLHRCNHPVEYQAWDLMLTLWVAGLMGEPASLVLQEPLAIVGCIVLYLAPTIYVYLRRRLHRAGRLRCDWLGSITS